MRRVAIGPRSETEATQSLLGQGFAVVPGWLRFLESSQTHWFQPTINGGFDSPQVFEGCYGFGLD